MLVYSSLVGGSRLRALGCLLRLLAIGLSGLVLVAGSYASIYLMGAIGTKGREAVPELTAMVVVMAVAFGCGWLAVLIQMVAILPVLLAVLNGVMTIAVRFRHHGSRSNRRRLALEQGLLLLEQRLEHLQGAVLTFQELTMQLGGLLIQALQCQQTFLGELQGLNLCGGVVQLGRHGWF